MKLDFNFVKACKETEIELDGVIHALGGRYIGPKTIVTYQNGDVVEYLIKGELGENSISNKPNVVKVEIGTLVSSIGYAAFYNCLDLSSIEIPSNVINIGTGAFSKCSSLSSITIPNSITSIGDSAFNRCTGLSSITIPSNVTNIKSRTFDNCTSLSSITIPNSITSIGDCAFQYCTSLSSITIPNSVTRIEQWIFDNCTNLSSITIPDSVTSINSSYIFNHCTNLMSIVVDPNNPVYDSRDNCNAIIRKSDNTLIAGCKTTIIPSDTINIGSCAFYNCTSLSSISIPSNVINIGMNAFYSCSKLSSITCLATTSPIVSADTFGSNNNSYTGRNTFSTGDNVLTIPLGATGYNSNAWVDPLQDSTKCGFHIDYIIPEDHDETVVWFNDGTISSYNIVGSIEMYNIQSIELSKITKIDIGNTVTEIGNASFMNCSNLTSVTIPSTVTTIGFDIFYDINALKSIVIPKTISLIKGTAFNSSALETITFIDRTISEVQAMQYYSWHLTTCSHGILSMQRTIVCTDGTFTINATENHEPV